VGTRGKGGGVIWHSSAVTFHELLFYVVTVAEYFDLIRSFITVANGVSPGTLCVCMCVHMCSCLLLYGTWGWVGHAVAKLIFDFIYMSLCVCAYVFVRIVVYIMRMGWARGCKGYFRF
jgi:hypothetical protein